MVIFMNKKREFGPSEFEKEYFPCSKEWWCVEGFFTTIEDNKKWSFRASFSQATGRDGSIGSVYMITLFDLERNKTYNYYSDDDFSKLKSSKDRFNIKFSKSFMEGSYPNYKMKLFDTSHEIDMKLEYQAKSQPYWVAQEITNGWLPWGLGYYRYGFIPKNEIKGTINIKNKQLSIRGEGYFEHVWGDFSFFYLLPSERSIKKTISIYFKLIGRWIRNQELKIPKSVMFSTDNRFSGYDWAWAILDNNWSMFYGNIMSYIVEGPATGVLILSKDGKKYKEFSNISFKYPKIKQLSKHDLQYPIELEITAKKDNEKLYLHIIPTFDTVEDLTEYSNKKNLLGFVVCQIPGKVNGYYENGQKKLVFKGLSKLETHRLLSVFGHNSLKFNFGLSQNFFNIFVGLDSNYFRKKIDVDLRFLPHPNLKINFKRIGKSKKTKYKKEVN